MATITEQLEEAQHTREPLTVILRSGRMLSGMLHSLDVTGGAVDLDGWTVRIDEIAALRIGHVDLTDRPSHSAAGLG